MRVAKVQGALTNKQSKTFKKEQSNLASRLWAHYWSAFLDLNPEITSFKKTFFLQGGHVSTAILWEKRK